MPIPPKNGEANPPVPKRERAPKPNSITTGELMGSARELFILHAEEQYRLRITSNGKLILTK
jgi:hemin uptake protein HemP